MKTTVIRDFEKLKINVDNECAKVHDYLNSSVEHGKDLRDKLLIITTYLSRYSKLALEARLMVDLQEERVEKTKALAISKMDTNSEYSKIPVTNRKMYIDIIMVNLDGEDTCYNDEKVRLAWTKYASNRFASILDQMSKVIMAYQSALNYDKEEMKSLPYVT